MILIFWHSEDFKNVKACHKNFYGPLYIYIFIMLKLIGTSMQLLARQIFNSIFLGFAFHNFHFLYTFILKCYFLLSLVSFVKLSPVVYFSFTLAFRLFHSLPAHSQSPLKQLIRFSCSQIHP